MNECNSAESCFKSVPIFAFSRRDIQRCESVVNWLSVCCLTGFPSDFRMFNKDELSNIQKRISWAVRYVSYSPYELTHDYVALWRDYLYDFTHFFLGCSVERFRSFGSFCYALAFDLRRLLACRDCFDAELRLICR